MIIFELCQPSCHRGSSLTHVCLHCSSVLQHAAAVLQGPKEDVKKE